LTNFLARIGFTFKGNFDYESVYPIRETYAYESEDIRIRIAFIEENGSYVVDINSKDIGILGYTFNVKTGIQLRRELRSAVDAFEERIAWATQ
jgi:hypothetical protein